MKDDPEPAPDLEEVSAGIAHVRSYYAARLSARESDRLLEAEEIVDLLSATPDPA